MVYEVDDIEYTSVTGKLTYVSQTEPNHPDTICLWDIEQLDGTGDGLGQAATLPGPLGLACAVPGS